MTMKIEVEVVHKIESLLGKFCDDCPTLNNSWVCSNTRKTKCYLQSEIRFLRSDIGVVEHTPLSIEEKRERKLKKQRETYKKSIMRSSVNYM